MEALGPNLRRLMSQTPNKNFSKTTVLMITIQLIKLVRHLHEMGFVHNDLKLDNILVGHKDPHLIYLIDFGLTCRFVNSEGSHTRRKYVEKFSGNFLFASLNSCRGNNKSRRDDIQSIFYIMAYLLNECYLPWSNFSRVFGKKKEFKDLLKERLAIKYTKEVFKIVPKNLRNIFKKVFTMQFEEEPPYDLMIDSISNEIRSNI
jgi:serine/threonine protein kinase